MRHCVVGRFSDHFQTFCWERHHAESVELSQSDSLILGHLLRSFPPDGSVWPQMWKEAVANCFLFKMMEVSGTSCAAEMLLQPPPDLRLDPTLSLGSGGCTSDLMTWRSLRDADYVADGIKDKGCAPQHSPSLGNQEDWNVF